MPTTDLLTDLALDGQLGIAAISRTEVVAGMRKHEAEDTLRFLNALACYPLDVGIADRAGALIRTFRRDGVTLDVPDAIIAATAMAHDLILLTYNPRHFPMQDLKRYEDMPTLS
jgi:predicted nucleic acid-binding protein